MDDVEVEGEAGLGWSKIEHGVRSSCDCRMPATSAK